VTREFADIRTPRLVLRPLAEADRANVLEIQNDPRANRFNPHPPTAGETHRKFTYWLTHWREFGFGYLAVVETGSEELIGVSGVQLRDHAGEQMLNLYYRLRPSAWGHGFASEAAAATVDWAERELPQYPVIISVAVDNTPSLRVAERLGFSRYVEADYDGALSRHYRR
jgi:RimJ/RimL family protein N-acetyltransferase